MTAIACRSGRAAGEAGSGASRSTVGVVTLLVLTLSGCEAIGYYGQAIRGQLSLLVERRPVEAVIDDPDTSARRTRQLERALALRRFAERELALPVDGRYATYAELDRPFVLWNVYATPPYRLTPLQWCFPVAGCVAYRGYFAESAARRHAARLVSDGLDTFVGGVSAYSTLGWFEDPLLSTFVDRSPPALAALLFHELAHARLYVPGATAFNESFATLVAQEGVSRWLDAQGEPRWRRRYRASRKRREAFTEFVSRWRERIGERYETAHEVGASSARMARIKHRAFNAMRRAFVGLARDWPTGPSGRKPYEAMMDAGLNNARLISVTTYARWVPAFKALLASTDGDLDAFYARCDDMAALSPQARRARLEALAPGGNEAIAPLSRFTGRR